MKKILYILPILCLLMACQENPDLGDAADPMVCIEEDSILLIQGATYKLTLSCSISGVEWTSSADSVASVNYQGRVSAHSVGEAIISADRSVYHSSCVVMVVADTIH